MIKMTEYAQRRKFVQQKVGPTGLLILCAAPEVRRNGDACYPYRQNSDFYYLTGFEEPEAVLILAPKRKAGEFILFNRVRDREREIWDGPRAGQEGACTHFSADQAFPIEQLETLLPELFVGRESIHYPFGVDKNFDRTLSHALNQVREKIRGGISFPTSFVDITPTLHEMRLRKSAAEIVLIKQAVEISAEAHIRAMEVCQPGMNEYELEAELTYEFQSRGARFPAYTSIVGSGRNSCVLHYIANNQTIADGGMVLIDAGAEYKNYASDITRTFPANGKFTAEQQSIYELVLASQLAAIKAIKPGVSWTVMQTAIVKVLTEGLVDLGILKGKVSELIKQQAYLPFYMHKSGHWLGLDVHDVGRYNIEGKWRNLEADMVLTVEPGLYISADIPGVPKRWHNIGVRIEDDILVTATGCEVLSHKIPKKVADIEALMAK